MEVSREYNWDKSDAILTTMEKGEEDWDGDTLVDGGLGPGQAKLASVKNLLSEPKERNDGSEMPVMGEAPRPVDHDDFLMDTGVSGSQGSASRIERNPIACKQTANHWGDGDSNIKIWPASDSYIASPLLERLGALRMKRMEEVIEWWRSEQSRSQC